MNVLEDIITLNNLTRTLVTQFYAPTIMLRWPLKSNYSTKPSAAKHEKELHQYFVFQPAIALTQAVWISGSTQESVRHSRSIKFDSSQEISVSSKAFYDDHPSRFNSSWIPTLTTLAVILFSRRRSAMNGERKLFYWNRSKTWTLSQLIHQNHLKIAVGVDKSSYRSSEH